MDKNKEYELLAQLEQETTRMRHTMFTALVSVSFILPGLAVNVEASGVTIFGTTTSLSRMVFLLGFIFYLFAIFHYAWYHRYSHLYRKELKNIEEKLGISIYRLRVRPQVGPLKLHFDWALYIIALIYGSVTVSYVGWIPFTASVGGILLLYGALMVISIWRPVEPSET